MSSGSPLGVILIGCVLMFLVLQLGTPALARVLDPTWSALIATAAMLGLALMLERLFFKRAPTDALRVLGFGHPYASAVVMAAIVALLMIAFFPVFALATGTQLSLRHDWWWVFIAVAALNGMAEETLFRGYVFGGLRRAGLSFNRAGSISLVIFAAVHLVLFVQNPFIVGLLGTLVAMTTAFPLAYLFERGNNTLWAPVILHAATHAIRLVHISEPYYMTAVTAWLLLQLGVPFLVFAFRGSFLRTPAT